MTSINLRKQIIKFRNDFEINKYLIETLKFLSISYDNVSQYIYKVSNYHQANDIINSNADARRNLDTLIKKIKIEIEYSQLYSEIFEFQKLINTLNIFNFDYLQNEIKMFLKSYDDFTKNYQFNDTLKMLSEAKNLYTLIYLLTTLLDNIIKQTEEEPVIKDNVEILELEFFEHQEINDLIIKFSAINVIYSELCVLFNISEKEYKLDIIKVETGSLLNKLVGHQDIIKEIISLIKSFATFLYETFSKTHKIQKLGKNIDIIEKTLNLCSSLENHGIDTSKLKENVQKSSITISEKLFELLSSEPKISIQNEIIELKNLNRQLYIDEGKKLLLTEGLRKTIT